MDGRLLKSRLPDDDDPWVWADGRQLVVSSSWGLTAPGSWIGVHINALPDDPIPGEFDFWIEVAEIDADGSRLCVIVEEWSLRTRIPVDATNLLQTYLPMKAPAYYRIVVRVSGEGLDAKVRTYLTVPPAVLQAELVPSRTRARPGESLSFAIVNAGSTPLFFGAAYELARLDGDAWVNCNTEDVWVLIGLTVPPGGQREEKAAIPTDAPPGRYRVSKDVHATGTNLSRTLSCEFDVADAAS